MTQLKKGYLPYCIQRYTKQSARFSRCLCVLPSRNGWLEECLEYCFFSLFYILFLLTNYVNKKEETTNLLLWLKRIQSWKFGLIETLPVLVDQYQVCRSWSINVNLETTYRSFDILGLVVYTYTNQPSTKG